MWNKIIVNAIMKNVIVSLVTTKQLYPKIKCAPIVVLRILMKIRIIEKKRPNL